MRYDKLIGILKEKTWFVAIKKNVIIILSVPPFPITLSDPTQIKVNNIIQTLMGIV